MKILTDTGLMVLWQRIKDLYKKISVSAKQTTTSTADGGTNVMTFTFGDGTSTTLSVKNGSKGSNGARGATGATGAKGEKGDRGPVGETGPQGNSGIADASNKALINDAVTGGETSYLSAEVGKLGILTYDCSKGGTVEHASLQDAINAVPTTFQKAGITIIYKSGDSIYRYALKSNSWSTDSANWFSVEEKVSDLPSFQESIEFIRVLVDKNGKILESTDFEGKKTFYGDTCINGLFSLNGVCSAITGESKEFLKVNLDSLGKILYGIRSDGDFFFGCGVPSQIANAIKKTREEILSSVSAIPSNIDLGLASRKNIDDKQKEFTAHFNESGECESFLFMTDPHLCGSNNEFDISIFYKYMDVVKTLFDKTPTSYILCGGDWLNSGDYKSIALSKLGFVDAYMRNHFRSYFPVFGNHDCNYQGLEYEGADKNTGNLGDSVVRNIMFRDYGNKYYCFKKEITKFYVFDTGIDWNNTMSGNWIEDNYRWKQIDWFANELINSSEMHIAIAMHIVSNGEVDTWDSGKSQMSINIMKVAEAYNSRKEISLNGKTYNFSNSKGIIHFCIAGHSHFDYVDTSNSIPIIVTTTLRQDNTPTFDLVLANYTTKKMYMTRVGSGVSRIINIV